MVKIKKFISFLMVVLILIVLDQGLIVSADESSEIQAVSISADSDYELEGKKQAIIDYYRNSISDYDDWELILSLFVSGEDLGDNFFETLDWDTETIPATGSASVYGSRMLALVAMNQEPRDMWGRDLVKELEGMQQEDGLFGTVTDDIYGVLALEALEGDYDKDQFIASFLGLQNEDGGYGFIDGTSDLDTTGVALALLAYFEEYEGVENTIDGIKGYIKDNQLSTGGFASWGIENANTIARIITGLVAISEDPSSEDWSVEGNSIVDALYRFELEDGSYAWILDIPESNLFSTKQVLIALSEISLGKSGFVLVDEMNQSLSYDITVVGIDDTIIDESVYYRYAGADGISIEEGLTNALDEKGISYSITDTNYGPYLTEINGIVAGSFSGYDGWQYQIDGISGQGMDIDVITDQSELLFYYGDMSPATVVPTIEILNESPNLMDEVQIRVKSTYDVYDENYEPTAVTEYFEGVNVIVNGERYLTDDNGIVRIQCRSLGVNEIVIYKKYESGLPEVVRSTESFQTVVETGYLYSDDADIATWARDAVYIMREEEIMEGYLNVFSPDEVITKAQLVKVLLGQLGVTVNEEATTDFIDVNEEKWYYKYIATAEELGLITGNSLMEFEPDTAVTREMLGYMVATAYNLTSDPSVSTDLTSYRDYNEISSWAIDGMKAMIENEILSGYNGELNPKGTVTREMCAVVLERLEK